MAKTVFTTPKGTPLPLVDLKGKAYLMVAYRLQWLNEENKNFSIVTDFLTLNDTLATCKAKVCILDANGQIVRAAEATKTEHQKHFADFAEKAETAAIGRALAMLGYGTQYALADLDEGERIVDSPLAAPTSKKPDLKVAPAAAPAAPVTAKTFKRPAPAKPTPAPKAATGGFTGTGGEADPADDWS